MAPGPDFDDSSPKIDALVGARVRMLRERRKMSQTALGEAIGVSFQQVQKYERGANRISASALFQIAKALSVAPSDFFEGLQAQTEGATDWSRMADPQVRGLVDNFIRIPSSKVKARIAELIEQLAAGWVSLELRPPLRRGADAGRPLRDHPRTPIPG